MKSKTQNIKKWLEKNIVLTVDLVRTASGNLKAYCIRLGSLSLQYSFPVADSREKAAALSPIDQMHLKTSENFARKCIIFA